MANEPTEPMVAAGRFFKNYPIQCLQVTSGSLLGMNAIMAAGAHDHSSLALWTIASGMTFASAAIGGAVRHREVKAQRQQGLTRRQQLEP